MLVHRLGQSANHIAAHLGDAPRPCATFAQTAAKKRAFLVRRQGPMGMRGSWEDLLELLQNFGRFLF